MNLKECYQRLELPPTATASETRNAYKKLVKNWHPDKFEADSPMKTYAEERLKIINAAYDLIRRHQSLYPSRSGTSSQPERSVRPTDSSNNSSQPYSSFNPEWSKLLCYTVRLLKRIFYSPNFDDTGANGTKQRYDSHKKTDKPFKRVLKELKSNRSREIISGRLKGRGFRSIYSLRHSYGPRHKKGLGPISDISSVERKQRIDPISKVAPIRKVR